MHITTHYSLFGNGGLELAGISGQIQMRGQVRTWMRDFGGNNSSQNSLGTPTTCTIVWKQNKWYASVTVDCEPIRETGSGAIGLDIGTLSAVAISDATKIDNPRFLANAQHEINQVSKQLRRKRKPQKRRTKASRRWKKVTKKVSKLHNEVANRRQNWVHQTATQIVSTNSLVATEELAVKNMTAKANKGSKGKRQKAGLNRSILDVGFGMLRSAIKYKVIEAGGVFIDVPTKKVKPSQTCPKCNRQQKKELDERIHQCPCGCILDRDVASAVVCLNYARGFGTSLLDGDGSALPKSPRSCGGFRQQSQMKRQKPTVA